MQTIELQGRIDEHRQLILEVPPAIPEGPVKVFLEFALNGDEEEEEDIMETDPHAWTRAGAAIWASEWSDPGEDIYTHEDGVPRDEAR